MTNSRAVRWTLIIAVLLIAWGLRLVALEEVPPGWRDDELINVHTLSSKVLEGQFPLYYLGASGHEPLYHHLHAGVHALFGFNVLSGHILSVMFGTLSIALTYSLVRRLFPRDPTTAIVASLTLAVSFWSLMYSRTGIRHISLPPFVLATSYAFWRQMDAEGPTPWGWGLVGLLLATSIYTYTASRLLPVLIIVFAGYLALFHRHWFQNRWMGIGVALLMTAVLVAPMAVVIARSRTALAIEGIGADARVAELAEPLRALGAGDPGPVIRSTVKTLGMFHASGDPEWLYNIPGRPVFNLLGGMLLWGGVLLCLYRWREPRYFFLLPWLGLGLSPAFISVPPASLGHTIVAQPVAFILPALALTEIGHGLRSHTSPVRRRWLAVLGSWALVLAFVVTNGVRDIEGYFRTWPAEEMVRILYRADYREIAGYLDSRPALEDVAVGSPLMGPWDRLALTVDTRREDVDIRLFDPRRALVWTADDDLTTAILTLWPDPAPEIEEALDHHHVSSESLLRYLKRHELSPVGSGPAVLGDLCRLGGGDAAVEHGPHRFGNGLELTGWCWLASNGSVESEMVLLTLWVVAGRLDLPPMPPIANPPPPGTYAGPRLAAFAHLEASDPADGETQGQGEAVVADDGFWVDPLTLRSGDRFIQIHRFGIGEEVVAPSSRVKLGLYDPKTGERWPVVDSEGTPTSDHVVILRAGR